MKIDKYIERLVEIRKEHGNLDVILYCRDDAQYNDADEPAAGIFEDQEFNTLDNIPKYLHSELNINSVSLN